MAQGIKSIPGAIEVGDLLFATKGNAGNSFVAYKFPQINSTQFEILEGDALGVVTALDVPDKNGQNIKYIAYRLPYGSSEIRYVIFDLAYLRSEANPEYNYPDGKTKKSIDFGGIFAGIGAVLSSLGGVLTANKPTLDGNSGYEYDPYTGTYRNNNPDVMVETSWWKRNLLYLILAALLGGIAYLFYRDKKEKKSVRTFAKK